ncbi:MAG: hydrogenase expression/formation protein HypE [Phycisphaerae bacterium]
MDKIQLAHGGGGKLTDELIDQVILKYLPRPAVLLDSAILETDGTAIAFTTDSYVVSPIFFPGGDVGKMAVFGTCNDLAMAGAVPVSLSLALIIEEGFEIEKLERIMQSVGLAAKEAEVTIVTGDTKVVAYGQADGIYINTAGIGRVISGADIGFNRIEEGDKILLSGTIGDHGLAIMAKREGLSFSTPIVSDVASVAGLANELIRKLGGKVKFLRDPTRAGLAGVLVDIASNTRREIFIQERAIPVKPGVKAGAEVLGFEVLDVANEGKFVAVVKDDAIEEALEICRKHPLGKAASVIGTVHQTSSSGRVVMETLIGGKRIVQKPYGEQLPRIC